MNNGVLEINNVSRKDGGTFICEAENILGGEEETIQVVIFSRLRFKIRPPAQLTAEIGSNLHLPETDSNVDEGCKAITSCRLQYSTKQHTRHFQCKEIARGILHL